MIFQIEVKKRLDDPSYRAGYEAFHSGKRRFLAPKNVEDRQSWYAGYLDAKYPEDRYEFPKPLRGKRENDGNTEH